MEGLSAARPGSSRAELVTSELVPLLDAIRFLELEAARWLAPRRPGPRGRPFWLRGVELEVQRDPLGLILVIGPGNYPLFLPGCHCAQALAAGNAALWKPAPGTAPVARAAAEAWSAVGGDPDLLVVLPEDPAEAEGWVREGRVDKVIVTGSGATGRAVLRAAAGPAVPVVAELSGCDLLWVGPGADLERAAQALRFGLRLNGGRTCVAPRRILVDRRHWEDFRALLRTAVEGAAAPPSGGEWLATDPWLVSFSDLPEPLPDFLAGDLFEPLAGLFPVADEEAALRWLELSPWALGASLFGSSGWARSRARQVPAGVVTINDLIVPTADPRLPFAGRRHSGFGVTRGPEGLLELTAPRAIQERRGGWLMHLVPPARPTGNSCPGSCSSLTARAGAAGADWRACCAQDSAIPDERRRPMARTDTVVVVGAGLGGLAAACTLGARGYRVRLFEPNPWPGGKAAVWEEGGYRFDMGPTILTLPSVFERVFAEAGLKLAERLPLVQLDPQWRCFFADGSQLDLVADGERMAASLAQYSRFGQDGPAYRRFLAESRVLHEISSEFFFWKPVGDVWDVMRSQGQLQLSALRSFLRMRPGSTVSQLVRRHVHDSRVAQMLDHFVQYVGSAPDQSPAVLCGIAHMQTEEGVWYPRGGTGAVPRALAGLAGELGVEIRLGVGVERILHAGGRVTGVRLADGTEVEADAVVTNADSVRTFRELVGGAPAERFLSRRRWEPACSGVVLFLGLDRRFDELLHHDFVFSKDPEEEFHDIYRQGRPARDPSLYLAAPARSEPEVAPPGGDALYVLVHTPYLRPGQDWRSLLPGYRRVILDKLERCTGIRDLEKHIVVESALTPADIHERYRVLDGAIYGLASHGRLHGAFKPNNRCADLAGLYLAGGAAHPGPGMPMVTMSGWIAADTLDRDGLVRPVRARV